MQEFLHSLSLQPTATVLGSWQVDWSHNTVVAVASALPVAVAELGRSLI
jgi:hypothetical protein